VEIVGFSRSSLAGPTGVCAGFAGFVAEIVQLIFEAPLSIFELFHFRISVVDDDHAF